MIENWKICYIYIKLCKTKNNNKKKRKKYIYNNSNTQQTHKPN